MKRVLTMAAALLAAGLSLQPDEASARPFGGRHGGGFGSHGFRHGGGFGFHGVRHGGFHRGFQGVRHVGWGGRHWGHQDGFGHRHVWRHHRGWGWGGGALAAGAIIGATAAAASYYPYDYDYGYGSGGGYYGGGYYPASYGGCGQQLGWVWTPYGYRRAWVSTCY